MNLILFERAELDDGQARLVLADRRARHACQVLGVAAGDQVRVGMIRGPVGTGLVLSASPERVELAVTLSEAQPRLPSVDLILAIPRPKALARVVESAATLGIGRLDLVNAWRVDKSYLRAHQLDEPRLDHSALLGCEQGAHTWVPDVAVHRMLVPFLRTSLTERLQPGVRAIIAHPRADTPLEVAVPPGAHERVIAAIGPDGGWIDRELDSFVALGFTPVSCGPEVLRVESAVVAVLAQLALLRRLQ